MSTFQFISLILSVVALSISGFTAYATFLVDFRIEVLVRPRIILSRFNGQPVLVLGCDLINPTSKAGAVDDIILLIKYRQNGNRGINRYTFFPILYRDNFSISKRYNEEDLEVFQSISISPKSRTTKYIVFNSSTDNFSPVVGQGEIEVFFRYSRNKKWHKNIEAVTLEIDKSVCEIWTDPQGKSYMIETVENYKHRDFLLDDM